jgi:hypothetical protein
MISDGLTMIEQHVSKLVTSGESDFGSGKSDQDVTFDQKQRATLKAAVKGLNDHIDSLQREFNVFYGDGIRLIEAVHKVLSVSPRPKWRHMATVPIRWKRFRQRLGWHTEAANNSG